MRVTSNKICKAIQDATGHEVELKKAHGIYWWYDPVDRPLEKCICVEFNESCTHMHSLSDWTVERWVEDFQSKLEDLI